jgi:hypothetical protein
MASAAAGNPTHCDVPGPKPPKVYPVVDLEADIKAEAAAEAAWSEI